MSNYLELMPFQHARVFQNGNLRVLVSTDAGYLHLSISHKERYPTWDEIKSAREEFLPMDKTFAIYFPPSDEYVNIHPNCFHLYEVKEKDGHYL